MNDAGEGPVERTGEESEPTKVPPPTIRIVTEPIATTPRDAKALLEVGVHQDRGVGVGTGRREVGQSPVGVAVGRRITAAEPRGQTMGVAAGVAGGGNPRGSTPRATEAEIAAVAERLLGFAA